MKSGGSRRNLDVSISRNQGHCDDIYEGTKDLINKIHNLEKGVAVNVQSKCLDRTVGEYDVMLHRELEF